MLCNSQDPSAATSNAACNADTIASADGDAEMKSSGGSCGCSAVPGGGSAATRGYGSAGGCSSWPLRYLLAWFSVVGAAVGLRLPPDLWQLACT